MEMFIKWLGRALFASWGVDGIACFYFKDRAIEEMHNPSCCKDAVSFTSLTDHPVLISSGTAFGYHLTEGMSFGFFFLMIASHAAGRRLAQSTRPIKSDR
jgi:hypothetical protein